MKTSFLTKSVMGIVMLAALTLSACAKKDDSASGRISTRGNTGAVVQAQTTCPTGTQLEGKIYDLQNYGNRFEQQVKAFVSATLDPSAIGLVSGKIDDPTGVDFLASFPFDSAGKLVAESSTLTIKIFDSFTKQTYEGKQIQPYTVEFSKASSGTYNRSTGELEVVFADDLGSITFKGRANGTYVEGKVYFDNNTSVSGSPQAGELGDFKINQCAMIK